MVRDLPEGVRDGIEGQIDKAIAHFFPIHLAKFQRRRGIPQLVARIAGCKAGLGQFAPGKAPQLDEGDQPILPFGDQ